MTGIALMFFSMDLVSWKLLVNNQLHKRLNNGTSPLVFANTLFAWCTYTDFAFAFKMSLDDLKAQEILQELLSQKHSGCEFTIKNEIAMNFQTVVDF